MYHKTKVINNGTDKYHLEIKKSKKSISKNCFKLIQYRDYLKEKMNSNYLVLVRHGQSEWNEKNLFTGWRDPGLTQRGIEEAHKAGILLRDKGLIFDLMFTSELQRAQLTGQIMLDEMGCSNLQTTIDQKLNERAYGDLTGMNKDEARAKFGAEQIHIWRRSYDTPPPGGESLKDTYDRAVPYFKEAIIPELEVSKNVLVAAHGNSLRAIVKYLEDISEKDIVKLEIATGDPIIYSYSDGSYTRI
tara:strand:- start:3356 stop:4090 length:735 start_codon:yes stop_codon:yes gene_type:complete